MDSRLTVAVRSYVADFGVDMYRDPDKLRAKLLEHWGNYKREITLLVLAVQEEIPSAIMQTNAPNLDVSKIRQMTILLNENCGMEMSVAHDTVVTWANILGKTILDASVSTNSSDQLIPSNPNDSLQDVANIISMLMKERATSFRTFQDVSRNILPNLSKDAFETWEEFATRVEGYGAVQVGEATLNKFEYDADTEILPITMRWKAKWEHTIDTRICHIRIHRHTASQIYGPTKLFPIVASLRISGEHVCPLNLKLVTEKGEFPVYSRGIRMSTGVYVHFGKYRGNPIVWRVIDAPSSGHPILLSDRILAKKAFDSAGEKHKVGERRESGSNHYESSNIRQWLNSHERKISWWQNDPGLINPLDEASDYMQEPGFLADGQFSEAERALIVPYRHPVLLADADRKRKTGGYELYKYTLGQPHRLLGNYDSAFYRLITDYVFLLSVKQLKEWVCDRKHLLGPDYHLGRSATVTSSNISETKACAYWLNTPDAASNSFVTVLDCAHEFDGYVVNDGEVNAYRAYCDEIGVRPALQLHLANAIFSTDGDGSLQYPYVVVAKG